MTQTDLHIQVEKELYTVVKSLKIKGRTIYERGLETILKQPINGGHLPLSYIRQVKERKLSEREELDKEIAELEEIERRVVSLPLQQKITCSDNSDGEDQYIGHYSSPGSGKDD